MQILFDMVGSDGYLSFHQHTLSEGKPMSTYLLRALALLALIGCNGNDKSTDTGGNVDPGTDADGDGYYAGEDEGEDCDDDNGDIYPGAIEDCDGVDRDCDGASDDGLTRACCDTGLETCSGGAWGACSVECAPVDGDEGGCCQTGGDGVGAAGLGGLALAALVARRRTARAPARV